MHKTIDFELNKFAIIPDKLRKSSQENTADSEFFVYLAQLYHHYYTDSWGVNPPRPNPADFEYLRFFAPCNDFRFSHIVSSIHEGKKRTISYEMGQAFCRYFLYEMCGITYFAHMDKVLDKKTHPAFNGMSIKRISKGDVPDYLCAKSVLNPFIGEAKGRFSNIAFSSSAFNEWREQFARIEVLDKRNIRKKLKGFIVATKFTTEINTLKNRSKLLAEDPETLGDESLGQDEFGLGRGCIAIHYAKLISKLGLNLLAQSLEFGFVVPKDIQYNLPIWRCNFPPLDGQLFVGGYFGDIETDLRKLSNGHIAFIPNALKLGIPSPSFYGLSLNVFKTLREVCLGEWDRLSNLPELPDTDFRPSNLSWLRDGSISGALEFFEFIGTEIF